MKISENTTDRLILDDVPWIRGSVIIVVTLYVVAMGFHEWNDGRKTGPYIVVFGFLIGVVFFAFFVERYQIIFQRSTNSIKRRKRSIFGYRETSHDLGAVSHAAIEKISDSDGGKMYQPVLIVLGGPDSPKLNLVDYATTGFGPPTLVDDINAWLETD